MTSTRTLPRAAVLIAALLAALAAVTLSGCGSETAPEDVVFDGSHVSASTFAAATEVDGVTVVDVRTPAEFAEGHLPGAVNIDINGADFAAQVAALDPDADYAVYCRSGNRSAAAIDVMTSAGVTSTIGLSGGIGAWNGEVVTG